MKAIYDSRADALSIDLLQVQRWEGSESVNETYCHVAPSAGRPANVELLSPANHLELLAQVAERYELDIEALRAAAQSALAAPDRDVTVEVAARTFA